MNHALAGFVQAVFDDGTVAKLQTPEELLRVLDKHEKYVDGAYPFFVSAADELNELSPVEVLAGKRFQAAIDNPVRLVFEGDPPKSKVVPLTKTDHAAHDRLLVLDVELRVAKVLHAARNWSVPL